MQHHVVLSLNDVLFEEGAVSLYMDDQGMKVTDLPTAIRRRIDSRGHAQRRFGNILSLSKGFSQRIKK
jgi:hypothetical protein|eukprot:evm.model.NODE_16172_length_3943_cov_41.039055.1